MLPYKELKREFVYLTKSLYNTFPKILMFYYKKLQVQTMDEIESDLLLCLLNSHIRFDKKRHSKFSSFFNTVLTHFMKNKMRSIKIHNKIFTKIDAKNENNDNDAENNYVLHNIYKNVMIDPMLEKQFYVQQTINKIIKKYANCERLLQLLMEGYSMKEISKMEKIPLSSLYYMKMQLMYELKKELI